MASGKIQDGGKGKKPETPPEKRPEPAGDPLAQLIDSYAEEIEPVPPTGEAGRDTGETK